VWRRPIDIVVERFRHEANEGWPIWEIGNMKSTWSAASAFKGIMRTSNSTARSGEERNRQTPHRRSPL
jgi:hypothetical protein